MTLNRLALYPYKTQALQISQRQIKTNSINSINLTVNNIPIII